VSNQYQSRSSEGQTGGGGRRFFATPQECPFCSDKSNQLDYKHFDMLQRYVTDAGKIRPRRQTGACAKHQRILAQEVKRARHLALLPYAGELLR
jgi:small subunit ribosomal protein S18